MFKTTIFGVLNTKNPPLWGFFCILEVLGMVWGGQQPPFLGFKHDF